MAGGRGRAGGGCSVWTIRFCGEEGGGWWRCGRRWRGVRGRTDARDERGEALVPASAFAAVAEAAPARTAATCLPRSASGTRRGWRRMSRRC